MGGENVAERGCGRHETDRGRLVRRMRYGGACTETKDKDGGR